MAIKEKIESELSQSVSEGKDEEEEEKKMFH